MTKREERKEIMDMVDELAESVNAVRNAVINYEYTHEAISTCTGIVFGAEQLKRTIYEAKVCKTK